MIHKKVYFSISEVSKMLDIEEHTIRFWDTKLHGLSKDSQKGKTRFFNEYHITKLSNLKKLLDNNNSLELAYKIITKNKLIKKNENSEQYIDNKTSSKFAIKKKKINDIKNKLKILINKH